MSYFQVSFETEKSYWEKKKNASAAQSVSSSLVTKVDFSVNKDNSKHNILKKISMVFFKSFFFHLTHTHTRLYKWKLIMFIVIMINSVNACCISQEFLE